MADEGKIPQIGRVIKQHRIVMSLTMSDLAEKSGVSASHLGRIERGERFPSARILRKIASPLGFGENELFIFADYLPSQSSTTVEDKVPMASLDPYAARVLSQESAEVQRTVIGILAILKSIAQAGTVNHKRGKTHGE